MIKNELEYHRTIRQWHSACSMYWMMLSKKSKNDSGLYQRWAHRSKQLDKRLNQYEKGQPRGWRGGRDHARHLKEVKEMIRQTCLRFSKPVGNKVEGHTPEVRNRNQLVLSSFSS